jgi:Spy/CpxP family protein refolding chaperone
MKVLRVIIFALAVLLLASVACWFTMNMSARRAALSHADAHTWIHSQLGLSKEQERLLIPIEERYDADKKHYGEVIRLANMELGQAILEDGRESPRVQAAVAQIHEAQGQLQNATLRHVFQMEPVLTPEQYKKLLSLTANALYEVEHAK